LSRSIRGKSGEYVPAPFVLSCTLSVIKVWNHQRELRLAVRLGGQVAKFFFHVKQDGELVTDDEGRDLPGMSEASRAALATARELLAEAIRFGKPNIPEAIIVEDEAGRPLLEVELVAVLPEPLRR
jgi:hypothetical protein